VVVDDHVVAAEARRPGRPKKLTDSELVCLAVAQVLLGARSEHHWLRMCYARLGHLTKCFLFTLRMSFSGLGVHRVFRTQGQEAFLEGHVYAFDRIDGVPYGQIRYDNLRSAVKRVLFGRSRVESTRWKQFRAHYGFTSFYCIPGPEGAHEKGGVEGDGGRFRRNHLVPVPRVHSIAELNERLAVADAADDARHIDGRRTSVGADFAAERPFLLPLPADGFDTALSMSTRWTSTRASRCGSATTRCRPG
jgi:hypothetical protein